ncbi:hypothetical protein PENDEC_c022G04646 [Penicillium decumbens]|uniref:VWFA domain-containing protein n=1 Tax=Penicillium decumbens TaxID=69771 RepID=A0A1V6P0Z6_PENDC|nr:hypothetical protein PENDEC_c022G04646 [Penicillium decumbens]
MAALLAVVDSRYRDKLLDVLVLTDGEVWRQESIFDFVNQQNQKNSTRFFTLGMGNRVSHSLVNGISRVGKGFFQTVLNYEDLNKTVVRMLKGALMPRLHNSKLDMKIPDLEEEFVEVQILNDDKAQPKPTAKPISLFDQDHEEKEDIGDVREPLPKLTVPSMLQAPADFPALFPFIRSTIYVLLSQQSTSLPETITLRADGRHAKKAVAELEESRGWIHFAKDAQGELIKSKWESRVDELVQKEYERLGVMFQVVGKHCSFVAVHKDPMDSEGYSESDRESNDAPSENVSSAQIDMRMAVYRPNSPIFSPTSPGFCPSSPNYYPLSDDSEDDDDDASIHSPIYSTKVSPLQKLIGLQTFDGYWDMDDRLLQTMGLDPSTTRTKLKRHYDLLKGSQATQVSDLEGWNKVLATYFVCHFLSNQAPDARDVWELVEIKAAGWLQAELDATSRADRAVLMNTTDGLESYF